VRLRIEFEARQRVCVPNLPLNATHDVILNVLSSVGRRTTFTPGGARHTDRTEAERDRQRANVGL
jgi:hypothetical protein